MKNDINSYVNKHKQYWQSIPNVKSIFVENNDTIVVIVDKDVDSVAEMIKCEFLVRVKLKR